jgi:hypothetical protein
MDYAERMRHIESKVHRAEKHLIELQQELESWLIPNPFKVGVKKDNESGCFIYFIIEAPTVPDTISLIAGDVIQNLATALDHLAYQLVSKNTSDPPPNPRGIYFPIPDKEKTYHDLKKKRLKGAHVDAIKDIDKIKPYKGGNNLLWELQTLNNIEKHRILLTAGANNSGINLDGMIPLDIAGEDSLLKYIHEDIRKRGIFVRPSNTGFPLKKDHILHTGIKGEPVRKDISFQFGVGIKEPGVVTNPHIQQALIGYKNEVQNVIKLLSKHLED